MEAGRIRRRSRKIRWCVRIATRLSDRSQVDMYGTTLGICVPWLIVYVTWIMNVSDITPAYLLVAKHSLFALLQRLPANIMCVCVCSCAYVYTNTLVWNVMATIWHVLIDTDIYTYIYIFVCILTSNAWLSVYIRMYILYTPRMQCISTFHVIIISNIYIYMYVYTHTHTLYVIYIHMYVCTHTHTHTHTQIHTHTHTHTNAYYYSMHV